jgi:hypothetical protein
MSLFRNGKIGGRGTYPVPGAGRSIGPCLATTHSSAPFSTKNVGKNIPADAVNPLIHTELCIPVVRLHTDGVAVTRALTHRRAKFDIADLNMSLWIPSLRRLPESMGYICYLVVTFRSIARLPFAETRVAEVGNVMSARVGDVISRSSIPYLHHISSPSSRLTPCHSIQKQKPTCHSLRIQSHRNKAGTCILSPRSAITDIDRTKASQEQRSGTSQALQTPVLDPLKHQH